MTRNWYETALATVFFAFFAGVLFCSFFLGRFLVTFFFSVVVANAEDEPGCGTSGTESWMVFSMDDSSETCSTDAS